MIRCPWVGQPHFAATTLAAGPAFRRFVEVSVVSDARGAQPVAGVGCPPGSRRGRGSSGDRSTAPREEYLLLAGTEPVRDGLGSSRTDEACWDRERLTTSPTIAVH
jgi:hypothetical protein